MERNEETSRALNGKSRIRGFGETLGAWHPLKRARAFASRPMHRDTVIGIVGVVILVAAMVGVFTYERSQASDLGNGDDTAATNFTATLSGTAPLGEENAEPETMTVNVSGLTNMSFTLTWTPGSQTSSDTLKLVVVMPDNMTHESEAENDGEITLAVEIPEGTESAGDWQVIVAFVSAEPVLPGGVQPPVPPPGSTDTSVSWNVDVQGSA